MNSQPCSPDQSGIQINKVVNDMKLGVATSKSSSVICKKLRENVPEIQSLLFTREHIHGFPESVPNSKLYVATEHLKSFRRLVREYEKKWVKKIVNDEKTRIEKVQKRLAEEVARSGAKQEKKLLREEERNTSRTVYTLPDEFVAEIHSGRSQASVAKELNVSKTLVSKAYRKQSSYSI